jgi:hypothetical protein
VIYLAVVLIILGVALFVAAPLFEVTAGLRGSVDSERSRLEHERALAVQALRELEFDREMRKLSEPDWAELKQQLEARALRAMAALEKLDQHAAARGAPASRRRVARIGDASPPAAVAAIRFCPACGQPVAAKINFCGACGAALNLKELSMTR